MNGRVDIDTVRDAFSRLGLTFAAEALAEALNDAVKEELPPHTVVNRLLTVELERREERRIRTALSTRSHPLDIFYEMPIVFKWITPWRQPSSLRLKWSGTPRGPCWASSMN